GCLRQRDRILRLPVEMDRNLDRLPEHLELVDRRRPSEIERREQHALPASLPVPRQLRRGRGLARSLKAREEDHPRAVRRELRPRLLRASEEAHELVVDDLDDLLPGRDALEEVRAHRAFFDRAQELAHDGQVDVCLEENAADLPQRLADVLFIQPSTPDELSKDAGKAVAQVFKHGITTRYDPAANDKR